MSEKKTSINLACSDKNSNS